MRVYTARWVVPVASSPVVDGAVAVADESIAAVGPRRKVLEAAGPGDELVELGDSVVLPGLINAHAHVELSWMADDPPLPGEEFTDWVRGLLERRAEACQDRARAAALRAIDSMVDRGTVAVGDIANETWVAPLLFRSVLEGVAFHEVYGFRCEDAPRLLQAAKERVASVEAGADHWRIAPTAHAPHTTSAPLIRGLAELAASRGTPFSIHVAESGGELSMIRDGEGPFVELMRERGMMDEGFTREDATPLEYLDRLGALSPRTLAVHCVHLTRADRALLRARGAFVVTCPRSNRRLGVGVAPVPELLAERIPVALGTDSLASARDLDLFAEMAALGREHPSLAPSDLLRAATLVGAQALGLSDRFGTIERGKSGRLVVVPLEAGAVDPIEAVCAEPTQVYPIEQAPAEPRIR